MASPEGDVVKEIRKSFKEVLRLARSSNLTQKSKEELNSILKSEWQQYLEDEKTPTVAPVLTGETPEELYSTAKRAFQVNDYFRARNLFEQYRTNCVSRKAAGLRDPLDDRHLYYLVHIERKIQANIHPKSREIGSIETFNRYIPLWLEWQKTYKTMSPTPPQLKEVVINGKPFDRNHST